MGYNVLFKFFYGVQEIEMSKREGVYEFEISKSGYDLLKEVGKRRGFAVWMLVKMAIKLFLVLDKFEDDPDSEIFIRQKGEDRTFSLYSEDDI